MFFFLRRLPESNHSIPIATMLHCINSLCPTQRPENMHLLCLSLSLDKKAIPHARLVNRAHAASATWKAFQKDWTSKWEKMEISFLRRRHYVSSHIHLIILESHSAVMKHEVLERDICVNFSYHAGILISTFQKKKKNSCSISPLGIYSDGKEG